jgi:Flp pilus assembly protein TadB
MTPSVLALLLGAMAVLVAPGPAGPRSRIGPREPATTAPQEGSRWLPPLAAFACAAATAVLLGGTAGLLTAPLVAACVFAAGWRALHGPHPVTTTEPLALAGAWDLMAACLSAGLPVPPAARAAAEALPGPAGAALRRAAELLALGADPQQAWQPALECPDTARLARVARRSGRSGAALAAALGALATEVRAGAREGSEARAQRAGVLITGPLGLCFLPAFLVIGVVPVVVGLAGQLVAQW